MSWILFTVAIAAFPRPSAQEAKDALMGVEAISATDDTETRARVMFESCAEMKSCAQGCEQALTACASPDVDASMRGRILAACPALGYNDPAVTVEKWIGTYTTRFYDAVAPGLDKASRAKFGKLRKKAEL